jgi:ABC-type multidrug transport system fused ATPase/permease subunit
MLLITHNLESLLRTDYIYLLHQGRIAEEGEPENLRVAGGLFQQLCEMKKQLQLFGINFLKPERNMIFSLLV